MPTGVEIVRLEPDEWQAYRELRLEALQESPQAFSSNYHEQAAYPESYWRGRLEDAARNKQSWMVFARAGQRLVGMGGAFRGGMDGDKRMDQAVVIAVYVTPSWRSRGVSKLLMYDILDRLKESGIRTAVLGINSEQRAALQLYELVGFRTVEKKMELMGDGIIHEMMIMEKLIS